MKFAQLSPADLGAMEALADTIETVNSVVEKAIVRVLAESVADGLSDLAKGALAELASGYGEVLTGTRPVAVLARLSLDHHAKEGGAN
jgi:hypothetical protein